MNFCSIYLMFLIWNFFFRIEKYSHFFIKKFIIKKKKTKPFWKTSSFILKNCYPNIKFLIRFQKKSSTTYSTNFFKLFFSKKKKTKILIYIPKYKISLYTKFSFYTQRIQNQPNLHDHGVVSLLNNFDSLNYFGS